VIRRIVRNMTRATGIALLELDSAAHAHEFYHSAAYQTAREKRLTAAGFRMTLLEGFRLTAAAIAVRARAGS
jgi:uncharacterized protein (DUF1330 family)